MTLEDISIRTKLQPGDIGYIICRHGKLYGEEYNYGISFETYVAEGMLEFYKNYNPALDCVWIAEYQNTMVGFILLMHRENNAAQLRYFYLEPGYRNIGLGKKLMDLFLDFLKGCDYTSCYLWTTHELSAAASLYSKNGFELTEEKESTAFDKSLTEQKYELRF